ESYVAGGAGSLLQAAGAVTIASYSSNRANATADGHAYSVVAGGAVLADSVVEGTNKAFLDAVTVIAGQLTVSAITSDESKALTKAGAGGIAAGSGSIATVKAESETSAYTGPSVSATVSGPMKVAATAESVADAESRGVNISATLSVGVSKAEARNAPRVSAYLGQSNTVSSSNLIIDARIVPAPTGRNESTRAYASGSTGGFVIGFAATETKAESEASAVAYVGDGSVLTVTGPVSVFSQASTKQKAYSTGKTIGGLAAGSNTASASSDTTTTAYLGRNVAVSGSLLDILAFGTDDNYAEAVAGTGGIIAGSGASAQTDTRGATSAWVSGGNAGAMIDVDEFKLGSEHASIFNAKTDTITASVVGLSGSDVRNDVVHSVTADVLDGAVIRAGTLSILAINRITKDRLGEFNVRSGSGGLFDGPAAASYTDIRNSALISVGEGVSVEVHGGADRSGGLTMSARNEVLAYDEISLDSGGAIALARADATINNSLNDARITIGRSSRLESSGDIALSAFGDVDLQTLVSAKTWGASGAAEGYSETKATVTNLVELGGSARLQADGDILLVAGRHDTNRISRAETYLWNRTAFPLETDPIAKAYLSESSDVRIYAGSEVGVGGDVRLLTLHGSVDVYGYGQGTDLYRESAEYLANLFNDVFEFTDKDITMRTEYRSSTPVYSSGVVVYGTVEAGRNRHKSLIIDEDGTISPESTQGITVSRSTENLVNTVQDRLDEVDETIELLLLGGVTDEERSLYTELLAEKGQLQARLSDLRDRTNVGVLNVDQPIEARFGSIVIDSLSLSGSGSLRARSDASILIENRSANYLRTNAMAIPDATAGVYFRGMSVASASDISAVPGGSFGGDVQVGGGRATISVSNTYSDPSGWGPDILVEGNITNLKGTVNIESCYGSVQVGKHADIVADIVRITAGRNVYIGYSDGFTHVAGEVRQRWAGIIDYYDGMWFSDVKLNESPRELAQQGRIDLGDLETPSLIAGNKVFIAGEYLNINGVVQSGVRDRQRIIWESSILDQIDSARRDYEARKASGGSPDPLYRLDFGDGPDRIDDKGYVVSRGIPVFYNAEEDCLEVAPVTTLGGYMELVGNIMNTGVGELRVLDGYSWIKIVDSVTGLPMKVRNVSTGTGGGVEGVIRIIDTAKRTDSTDSFFDNIPLVTEISRVGSQIQVRSNRVNPDREDPLTLTTLEYTTSGSSTEYRPLEYQYYTLTTVSTRTETYSAIEERLRQGTTIVESWLENISVEPDVTTHRTEVERHGILSGHSETYWHQGSRTRVTGDWEGVSDWQIVSSGGAMIYERRAVRQEHVESTVSNHHINASNPIGIKFIGYSEGDLEITTGGDIIVDGLLESRSGWVKLGGNSIIQSDNPAAGIRGEFIRLWAEGSIGSTSNPLITDLLDGELDAWADGGDVFIKETAGDIIVSSVEATGEVHLVADRSIESAGRSGNRIAGERVVLESERGGIGTDQSRVVVRAGSGGLAARAQDSIYVEADVGDLPIDSVVSLGGDVDLLALRGSIIDVNPKQEKDERAEAEVLEFWERSRLIGEAAKRSADDAVAAYEGQKLREYQTYWQHRERFTSQDGKILPYSPSSVIVLSQSERAYLKTQFGWTARMIGDYEAHLTAEYHELHSKYGSVSSSFDSNWRYTVAKPVDSSGIVYDPRLYDTTVYGEWHALTQGHSWSVDELRNSVNKSYMAKELTDTKVWIEDPNVVGRNITLAAPSGSIGHDQDVIVPIERVGYGKPRLSDLTAEQIVMLLTAEKKDVTFWKDFSIKITARETVDLEASESISASAQDFIYLASETDMKLDRITAGGEVRIKANGAIESAWWDGQANIIGGDTFLEAGHGSIGESQPLNISIGGSILTARGYYVDIQSFGDVTVDEIYGRDGARLTSSGSIFGLSVRYPVFGWKGINFRAANLSLSAGGSIGSAEEPLTIKLDSTGMLHAQAYADMYISSPDSSLTTGYVGAQGVLSIVSGGDVYIRSTRPSSGSVPYGILAVGGMVSISAGGSILDADDDQGLSIAASQIHLSALGSIGTADNDLELQTEPRPGSPPVELSAHGRDGVYIAGILGDLPVTEVTSSRDVRVSATNGALLVGQISAGDGTVTLIAGTNITNTLPAGETNIVASRIGLVATGGRVGSILKPLRVDTQASFKDAISVSAGDDIFLSEIEGDMVLSEVRTSKASGAVISLSSYGGIVVGDTVGRPSIVLDGANGTILFAAQGDIGEANTPLIYSASNDTVFMAMTEGSMYVTGASGILADSIAARSKAVLRAASGDIQRTQTGTITAGWVELFAEQGGIGMKGHRVIVSTTRVSALAYGNIFLEIQGRYVLSDYIKSLAGTVDVYRPGTIDQLLAGLSQTDRILGGMASGGSIPQLST
ncbi:MAG: hypothetical protein GXX08_00455, partial [Firmicutes bacterium]|nr:hypothetical protein [Bacillota bacterium]